MKSTNLLAWDLWRNWKLMPWPPSSFWMLLHFSAALCLRMSCSRNKNVLLWSTFCLTCTCDYHKCGVYTLLQSSHYKFCTMNSITNVYCTCMPLTTSFWIVSFTLSYLEWGSVQMKDASTSLTLLSPFMCLRQSWRSCGDSRSHYVHGGL